MEKPPQNTDTKIYLHGEIDLEYIMETIKSKWPGVNISDITIEAEYLQHSCFGYDLFDSGDYANFIAIRNIKKDI